MLRSLLLATVPILAMPCGIALAQDATDASEPTTEELAAYGEALAWDAIWDIHDAAAMEQALEDAGAVLSSNALAEQVLSGNHAFDATPERRATINDSFNDNTGVIGVNQNAGLLNNQGNVVAVAFADADVGALRINDADVVQRLDANSLTTSIDRLSVGINDSFNNIVGILGVNQVAGSLNNQANVVALTFGADAGPAATLLSEAVLAQVGDEGDNELVENKPTANSIQTNNSFNNFTGVAQVNRVVGNFNQVANVLGVSVSPSR
jgi:hypothetical protein